MYGQYFAKPVPVANERLLRGSEGLRLRLNYRPSHSLSEPKYSNHPEQHDPLSLCHFFISRRSPGSVHSSEFHLTATPAALQRSNERCWQDSQKEVASPSDSYCWVDTDRHALCARVSQNRGAAQHSRAHSMAAAAATSATATSERSRALMRT